MKKKKPFSPFPKEVYERNSEIYKIMSNQKRLEILNVLKNSPATLSELTKIVGVSKANISQHLAVLKHLRLVATHKKLKEAYYSIVDPRIVEPCRILRDIWKK